MLLLATGSEVPLCLEAYEKLTADGIPARVVSMPSWELFEYHCRQHPRYREQVLPSSVGLGKPRSRIPTWEGTDSHRPFNVTAFGTFRWPEKK